MYNFTSEPAAFQVLEESITNVVLFVLDAIPTVSVSPELTIT